MIGCMSLWNLRSSGATLGALGQCHLGLSVERVLIGFRPLGPHLLMPALMAASQACLSDGAGRSISLEAQPSHEPIGIPA